MPRGPRRILLLIAGGVAIWYLVVLFSWGLRPLHDSIPVGTDYTLKQPRLVSQKVTCHTLFSSSTFDGIYPDLKPQPVSKARPEVVELAYQREACALVQRDARIVFALDTLGALVVISGLMFVALRTPKEPAGSHRDPAPAIA